MHRCAHSPVRGIRSRPALAVLAAALFVPTAHAQWNFVNLHPGFTTQSEAYDVHSGAQVGYAVTNATPSHVQAVLWRGTPGTWSNLGGGAASEAFGTFYNQQVGYLLNAGVYRATMWNNFPDITTDLHPAGASWSVAFGVNSGEQVGAATIDGITRAGLWRGTAGSWRSLHPAGADESQALGTAGGQQVGWAEFDGVPHAGMWSGYAASWVDLNPDGAANSRAYAIDSGQQVGVALVGDTVMASLWSGTAASWTSLHPAGAQWSFAADVHMGFQVGAITFDGVQRAALWSSSPVSRVDLHAFLPGQFITSQARGVYYDGATIRVVGSAYNVATSRLEAIMWVGNTGQTHCPADFNGDGAPDSQDFFDFLSAFFALAPAGDVNNDTFIDSQDFFDFITAFVAGC